MFADDPSPFQPHEDSLLSWATVIAVTVATAAGLALYVARVAEHNNLHASPLGARPPITHPALQPPPPPLDREQPSVDELTHSKVGPPRELTSTIYLCKGYSGGNFWSNAVCSSQRATIDRMTTVPADLSFSQQVSIASGQAEEAAQLYIVQPSGGPATVGATASTAPASSECAWLIELTKDLDASALRPQSVRVIHNFSDDVE